MKKLKAGMRHAFQSNFMQARACADAWVGRWKGLNESGQGTTEYAILVGVLVVIAIVAITVFRPKIEELWDAISSGINSL